MTQPKPIRRNNAGKIAHNITQGLVEGQFFYLMGGRTKVKIIGHTEHQYPDCMVIEVSPKSKYKDCIGQIVNISRQVLYPRQRKRR